jgi:hypothetical protein
MIPSEEAIKSAMPAYQTRYKEILLVVLDELATSYSVHTIWMAMG